MDFKLSSKLSIITSVQQLSLLLASSVCEKAPGPEHVIEQHNVQAAVVYY